MCRRPVDFIQATVEDGAETEGKFDLTDINVLIQCLTKLLKKTFPESVTIALDLDSEVRSIMVDANQINQAVLNLCVATVIAKGSMRGTQWRTAEPFFSRPGLSPLPSYAAVSKRRRRAIRAYQCHGYRVGNGGRDQEPRVFHN
jgi:hypothetical protein